MYDALLCLPSSLLVFPIPTAHIVKKKPTTISDQSVSACDLLNTKQDCQPIHRDTNIHTHIHSTAGLSRFRVAEDTVAATNVNKPHELKCMTEKHVHSTLKFKRNAMESE